MACTEPEEHVDDVLRRLILHIPESTLLLPCTDTEEASRRILRSVASTSCLLPERLGRNLALPESELQGVLYTSRGDLKEDRCRVSSVCFGVVNFHIFCIGFCCHTINCAQIKGILSPPVQLHK